MKLTLYEVLGVPRYATTDEIKRAYRRIAMASHPDRESGGDVLDRFHEATKAYHVLIVPDRRSAYDRALSETLVDDPRSAAHQIWKEFLLPYQPKE